MLSPPALWNQVTRFQATPNRSNYYHAKGKVPSIPVWNWREPKRYRRAREGRSYVRGRVSYSGGNITSIQRKAPRGLSDRRGKSEHGVKLIRSTT